MNQTPNPGFVQVSVNSQKLNDYLFNIQSLIKKQELKIQELNKQMTTRLNELSDMTQRVDREIKTNEKDLKQMIIQQAMLQKEEIKKANEKTQYLFEDLQQRINQVNSQVIEEKQKLQQVANKTAFAYEESKQIRTIKISISNIQKQVGEIKSDTFKKMLYEYLDKAHEQKVTEICQQNFFKILENDRVREIICNRDYLSTGQDRGLKKENLSEKEAIFYASVTDKIEKLEKKLTEKNNISEINKVLYPSSFLKNNLNWTGGSTGFSTVKNSSTNLEKDEIEQIALKSVSAKIQTLQQTLNNKISEMNAELKSQILRQSQKSQLFAQKNSILTRKLQKERSRINDLVIEMKKNSERKVDQKLIDTFRYEIRQKTLDYQDNLDSKINRQLYEKDRNKLNQRIKILHENLTEKSDKSEIKKAIQFLQNKIKELILLVAGSYDQDRIGSIKKTPIKCLSCDKDLDAKLLNLKENILGDGYDDPIKSVKRSESAMKLRCATSRMRKHIRLNSGTGTPNCQTTTFGFD